MKPIIIYVDKSDVIKLTKKEFEQYIKDAYSQGYDCGYAEGKKYTWNPYWYNNPITYTSTTGNMPPTITTDHTTITTNPTTPLQPDTYPKITWTCDDALSGELLNALGDR